MRSGPTRVDELVATLLPKVSLPSHLTPAQLLDADVVPPAKYAAKVLALRELVRHGGRPDDLVDTRIASSADIAAYYLPRLRGDTMESLHVVGLDARQHVRFTQCVARGGISSCAVTPRDVLRPVLLNASAAMVVVHNHPSGDPSPSPEDVALTERLVRGAEVLGVRVLDHVVIGAQGHFSFLDAGMLGRG
ncbi:MAG: JAB domain-containing protein [Sandaracinus sp.]